MRKVLSFVLVLSLVLGSFSMAFAATPATGLSDINGIANEEAIQVNFDLGIVTGNPDGTFLPAKTVTRAEFAAMVTRALAIPDSALAGYTATTFKDTAGYSWAVPYLAFCQSKGIMLGDGNGNAMPGRTINTNEAVTMAMRAIGYTANSAQLVGAWPSNYVTLAQNSDLYDDVANVVNVDKANAAQIIYNLLTVEKVAVNSDGETTGLNTNLLTSGLGCTQDAAAVIRGTEDADINLKPYVGAYAVTYSKSGDVVAVGEVKSDFLTGEYDATVGDENLDVDGTDYSFDKIVLETTPTGVTIVNGYATASAGGVLSVYDDADVTLAVDKNGKTIKKIYSVAVWNVTNAEVIDAAGLKALDDDELLGEDFALNDDDELDLNSFELVGATSLDKIAADDVVYVYTNGNTDKIAKVAVGTEVVTGKVTEVDGTKFVIGGKTYKLASDAGVTALGNITPVQAGWTITAQLDAYGYVFDYDKDDADADTYGVVKYYQGAGIDNAKAKLYTSADATSTIEIDDDVIDAVGYVAPIVNELVGYALDSNGVIETLDTTATATNGALVATLQSVSVVNVSGSTIAIAKDVVVFTYDTTDGFDVTTIDKVKDDVDLNGNDMFQYIKNSDGYIVAMVVDAAAAGKTSDDSYGVVNKVTGTVDADDDAIQRIQGFANGAALDKNTTKNNVVVDNINGASPILYKVEFDAEGLITKVTSKAAIAAATGVTVNAINSERTAIQATAGGIGTWIPLADGVVVYEVSDIGTSDMTYKVSGVNSMRAANNYKFWAYDTDTDEAGAEVVIFVK